jgi:hypothetical protein
MVLFGLFTIPQETAMIWYAIAPVPQLFTVCTHSDRCLHPILEV